jgi:hypothetical protein
VGGKVWIKMGTGTWQALERERERERERACLFCLGQLKERKNMEDIVIKGWIIIKWTLKKFDGGDSVVWIHLAQGRGKWRFLVHTAVKILVPYSAGNFLTNRGTDSTSKKGLYSVPLGTKYLFIH